MANILKAYENVSKLMARFHDRMKLSACPSICSVFFSSYIARRLIFMSHIIVSTSIFQMKQLALANRKPATGLKLCQLSRPGNCPDDLLRVQISVIRGPTVKDLIISRILSNSFGDSG